MESNKIDLLNRFGENVFFLIDLYNYSKWLICIYNSHHTRMILNITFNKSKNFKNDRK